MSSNIIILIFLYISVGEAMVGLIPSTTHTTGDFLHRPRSAFPPLELFESDVVWSFLPSPDSISFSDSTSPCPPFMHDRRRHNHFGTPQSGISAVLGDDHRRLVGSQSKIIPALPRSDNVQVKFHHSAPVSIPVWPNKFSDNLNEINDGDGDLKRLDEVEEEEEEEDEKMVPPHLIVARSHVTFSVFEGVGRTLKGRDLRRVRNAVFQKTGEYVDEETGGGDQGAGLD
ncbi:uncharacterized protein LOC142540457 isoform X2 [Primulina tabacum]|uniref:uncharacterized protein LOC142540457 isoform X2 n=1 Tax=Primulina tabacum TaxID=48773 RepID=UPI003F5961DC